MLSVILETYVKSFFVVQNFNIALNKVDFIGAIAFRDALISGNRVKMGRTRENQGIYSLNSWEKGAAVSERKKAQLRKFKEVWCNTV